MDFPSISHRTGKCNKNLSYEEELGNWYSYFSHKMGTIFPSNSHPLVYFITWKMRGFSHQFVIAREYATKPIVWRSLENWYSYFFHGMGTFFSSDFHAMVCFITWEMHEVSYQFPIARESASKPILRGEMRYWHSYLSHCVITFQSDFHPMVYFIT